MSTEVFRAANDVEAKAADNPFDITTGCEGEWYCESHPEYLMGHDGCRCVGMTADQRIPMLVNQRRLARQSVRECHHMYRDFAAQHRALVAASVTP